MFLEGLEWYKKVYLFGNPTLTRPLGSFANAKMFLYYRYNIMLFIPILYYIVYFI